MSNCAIVGINWGDEGKGRMVDLLAEDYDVVMPLSGRQQRRPHRRQRIRQVRSAPAALRHFPCRASSTCWATASVIDLEAPVRRDADACIDKGIADHARRTSRSPSAPPSCCPYHRDAGQSGGGASEATRNSAPPCAASRRSTATSIMKKTILHGRAAVSGVPQEAVWPASSSGKT